MKIIKNIIVSGMIGLGFASCSNEAPFSKDPDENGEGRFLTTSLSVNVKLEEAFVRAEASSISVNDFTVEFVDPSHPNEKPIKTYTYGSMPDVVVLPVGTYQVRAYYGGKYTSSNLNADFNKPYYLGLSQEFTIEQNKIVDNIEPIECKLANVKVTILFDNELIEKSRDSKVTVMVGNSGPLDFYPSSEESGYFKYVEGSTTLTAEYTGIVEGEETRELKTKDDVFPGTHYRITFKLHAIDPNEPGTIIPGGDGEDPIKIDATVNLEDLTGDGGINIEPGQEEYLDDDRKPKEDPDPVPDDPESYNGPKITAEAPINLDDWNVATEGLTCVLNVHSETGITNFTVSIDSESLTEDILSSVGLAKSFDLINPESEALADGLTGLGLPIRDEVLNQKDVVFNVSQFMGLLGIYGAANHRFILNVGDSTGTRVVELKLRTE